jgi:hypothetical protein
MIPVIHDIKAWVPPAINTSVELHVERPASSQSGIFIKIIYDHMVNETDVIKNQGAKENSLTP